ncbi:MAG: hypothetical protein WD470_07670, partial [Rhodospirillaceae bacterium]
MSRVSNIAQHERIVSLIMQTQVESNKAELQIASGRKSQTYQGIARDSGRLVEMEISHVRVSQYASNNAMVEDRLQLMESNVAQIADILSNFKALIINALNSGNAIELNLANQANEMMAQ